MKRWLNLLAGVLIGLLAAGAVLLIAQPERGIPITLAPAPSPTITNFPKPTATPSQIEVLIKGQVVNPGIYALAKESRLMDLIELAGGITDLADVNRINDVYLLRDGDYFYIPSIDEKIPDTARNAPGNSPIDQGSLFQFPLNINTASQDALETLPGIGPSKAADIIAYREQAGFFNTIEDLLNVPGIGPTILDSIRDFLIVEH
jgi:competence protein ComEA